MMPYHRIFSYYRPFKKQIIGALFLVLLTTVLNILKPWPIKWVVDGLLGQHSMTGITGWLMWEMGASWGHALIVSIAFFLTIHLAWGTCQAISTYWLVQIGLQAVMRLRTALYSHLQSLSLRFHDERRSGDTTFRVAYDSQAIQTFFNRGFITVFSSLFTLIGTFVVMYSINVRLSFFALAVIPFLLMAIAFFAKKIREETSVFQKEESDVLVRAGEGLSAVRVIHAFGREKEEVHEFHREATESLHAHSNLNATTAFSTFVVTLVMAIGTAVLLYVGAKEVAREHMTVGDLIIFLSYLAMLYQPLEQLSYTAWALEGASVGLERSFEILDIKNDVSDFLDAKELNVKAGEIIFEHVEFEYEKEKPVLRDISLVISAGSTVALVGSSGAGKSTILSLLARFYDPQSGYICIDGQNIREVRKKSLRQNIAMVLQETVLLNTTIFENIAYGNPSASFEEIREAARDAHAEDFILSFPQGYHTHVGERGVKLSGGQRQRIGIARAFLKQSPILLLDEPTSSLDWQTESEVMETLRELMRQPTTLIVTHRLRTIHHVDQIYVMDQGRVVEQGKGPELLERKGFYWKLWNSARYA